MPEQARWLDHSIRPIMPLKEPIPPAQWHKAWNMDDAIFLFTVYVEDWAAKHVKEERVAEDLDVAVKLLQRHCSLSQPKYLPEDLEPLFQDKHVRQFMCSSIIIHDVSQYWADGAFSRFRYEDQQQSENLRGIREQANLVRDLSASADPAGLEAAVTDLAQQCASFIDEYHEDVMHAWSDRAKRLVDMFMYVTKTWGQRQDVKASLLDIVKYGLQIGFRMTTFPVQWVIEPAIAGEPYDDGTMRETGYRPSGVPLNALTYRPMSEENLLSGQYSVVACIAPLVRKREYVDRVLRDTIVQKKRVLVDKKEDKM